MYLLRTASPSTPPFPYHFLVTSSPFGASEAMTLLFCCVEIKCRMQSDLGFKGEKGSILCGPAPTKKNVRGGLVSFHRSEKVAVSPFLVFLSNIVWRPFQWLDLIATFSSPQYKKK